MNGDDWMTLAMKEWVGANSFSYQTKETCNFFRKFRISISLAGVMQQELVRKCFNSQTVQMGIRWLARSRGEKPMGLRLPLIRMWGRSASRSYLSSEGFFTESRLWLVASV